MDFISAASDPGYRNYGYSVVAASCNGKLELEVLEVGMFATTITNLTGGALRPPKSARRKTRAEVPEPPFVDQLQTFERAWKGLFSEYPVNGYTAERFQTRGIKGKSIECVTTMNAVSCMVARVHGARIDLITAATWKNALNKVSPLEQWYGHGLTDHTVDSLFISIYGVLKHFNLGWSAVPYPALWEQLQRIEQ